MTRLPVVTITASDGGWLAACDCEWLAWHARRPAADRVAHEHRAWHGRKR